VPPRSKKHCIPLKNESLAPLRPQAARLLFAAGGIGFGLCAPVLPLPSGGSDGLQKSQTLYRTLLKQRVMNILEALLLILSAVVFWVGLITFRRASRFLDGFSVRRFDNR